MIYGDVSLMDKRWVVNPEWRARYPYITPYFESYIMWTQEEAIELCKALEKFVPEFGCHVALTGGCLYSDGQRKDVDIMFYRIRQVKEIDEKSLYAALTGFGITFGQRHGWVQKAFYEGKSIDFFFPEYKDSFWDHVTGMFVCKTSTY